MKHIRTLLRAALLLFTALPAIAQPRLAADNIEEVISAMTLEEKARMVNGIGNFWGGSASCRNLRDVPGLPGGTYDIPRLGIPAVYFGDGPLGLRISEEREYDSRHYYTTAVPVPLLAGSSWDPEMIFGLAQDIAEECRDYGVDVMLGPSFNILRNPLGGRTHEYYSEDPYLAGILAGAFTEGVQSIGIGASVKHFTANNQESNRYGVNSIISQRALREIYLKPFEISIKECEPWTVMTSYNGVNGLWTSENKELIEGVLRTDWGFKGMVMTDWGGGVHPVMSVYAGNDLIEPGDEAGVQAIINAVQDGTLSEADLDRNVKRILEMVVMTYSFRDYEFSNSPDLGSHQIMARKAGGEGAVLLKNDGETLPFATSVEKIAVYGRTGYNVIPGGIGFNESNTGNYCISLVEGLRLAGYEVDYSVLKRYRRPMFFGPRPQNARQEDNDELIIPTEDLRKDASVNDIAIISLGHIAGEGYDRVRSAFYLTEKEKQMLKDVTEAYHTAGKKVVVLLNIPGPIEVESWKDIPDAILCIYQGGEQLGNWVTDVLKGEVTPSGKLTVTFAKDLMDYPSSRNYPVLDERASVSGMMAGASGDNTQNALATEGLKNIDYTLYEEGIYVGYRYFETFGVDVSYPFGYGLSYTTFEYSEPQISRNGDEFIVSVKITNTGKYDGREVVQLYVTAPEGRLDKPVKELKDFAKTATLRPGESETLKMSVSIEELASFNSAKSRWETDKGTYTFMIAASVKDVKAQMKGRVDKAWHKTVSNVLAPDYDLQEIKPE